DLRYGDDGVALDAERDGGVIGPGRDGQGGGNPRQGVPGREGRRDHDLGGLVRPGGGVVTDVSRRVANAAVGPLGRRAAAHCGGCDAVALAPELDDVVADLGRRDRYRAGGRGGDGLGGLVLPGRGVVDDE